MDMGEIRTRVRLENYDDRVLWKNGKIAKEDVRVQEIEGVADTGAVMTLLPQDLVEALGLKVIARVVVALANEQKIELDKVGPISLTVCGRNMMADCLVGPPGSEPLIGQLVMEELDLIADPLRKTLTPRPESPWLATLKLKGVSMPEVTYSR
jgi:predicted aspartyl protease